LQRWLNRDPMGDFGSMRTLNSEAIPWFDSGLIDELASGDRVNVWLSSNKNLQRFGHNNPISYVDPLGLCDMVYPDDFVGPLPLGAMHESEANDFRIRTEGEGLMDSPLGEALLGGLANGLQGEAYSLAAPLKAGVRTEAKNLAEQLAMKEAKAGAGSRIMKGAINDPKYPENLWAKMQHVHPTPDGNSIAIHYWKNLQTGQCEGFKFK
jgi:hypothetical protein